MGPPSPSEDWKAAEWYREGFVTYYGSNLALRASLIDLPKYLESLNRDIRLFPSSHNAYVRGRVIVLWLDQRISKDSSGKKSLDTVMYDMVNEAAKPLTESRILETAGRYISAPSRTELAQIVQPNSTISLSENGLGPCVQGSMDHVPTFDLGFDLAASRAASSITSVEMDGPAYQAGLRTASAFSGRLSVYQKAARKSCHRNRPDHRRRKTNRILSARHAYRSHAISPGSSRL